MSKSNNKSEIIATVVITVIGLVVLVVVPEVSEWIHQQELQLALIKNNCIKPAE